MSRGNGPFYGGLGLITGATLTLEVVCARVFSVVTWYHLSFLAVSIAMLGMTAGAVFVYLRPTAFARQRVPASLVLYSCLFALSIPLSHLCSILPGPHLHLAAATELGRWFLICLLSAVPFFLSGVVVALSLTKVELPIGRVYAADLLGAGGGCLLAVVLLNHTDPTSGLFLLGGLTALGGAGYAMWRCVRGAAPAVLVAGLLLAWGVSNHRAYPYLFRLGYTKNLPVPRDSGHDEWNSHSRVLAGHLIKASPPYWGEARDAPRTPRLQTGMLIDGAAATMLVEFSGDLRELDWARFDVANLAYELRGREGNVAVIGVGGGRDLLTAIAFECRHVTGIEINDIFLRLLRTKYRHVSRVVGRPDVSLVHDDGRSFLARTRDHYDLIQMSLVDTWAATSAGSMTLSEHGLYTLEAWRTFWSRLSPGGILTVSRWFSPQRPYEATRLVSLAAATVLAEGVADPRGHLVLAVTAGMSTLLLSRDPFSTGDLQTLTEVSRARGYRLPVFPGRPPAISGMASILAAASLGELRGACAHPVLDLLPPEDDRPFFFNLVRAVRDVSRLDAEFGTEPGVIMGNIRAQRLLRHLLLGVTGLVFAFIVCPLLLFGNQHGLTARTFSAATAYFLLIGLGFMLVQIGLVQRFSVLLGHPVYALAIVLCSMIVFAGLGSLVSERLDVRRTVPLCIPPLIACVVAAAVLLLQPVTGATQSLSLPTRAAVVLLFTAPIGLGLGLCFPMGMRVTGAHSESALPWMWGINGGSSVVGTVAAVMLSMSLGISRSLLAGAACYLILLLPLVVLRRPAVRPLFSQGVGAATQEAWVVPAAFLLLVFVFNMVLWRLLPCLLFNGLIPQTPQAYALLAAAYVFPSLFLYFAFFRRRRAVLGVLSAELLLIALFNLHL